MFTVALVGLDGCGKSTLARRLAAELPLPASLLYFGVNQEASNVLLPTTRAVLWLKRRLGGRADLSGPAGPEGCRDRRGTGWTKWARLLRSCLRVGILASEEAYRHALLLRLLRRGRVVLCDRHFACDYLAAVRSEPDRAPDLPHRIHGWWMTRLIPWPDLVILLDAPAGVLRTRKDGPALEWIERRRRGYLRLGELPGRFTVVDAALPADAVFRNVRERILRLHSELAAATAAAGSTEVAARRTDPHPIRLPDGRRVDPSTCRSLPPDGNTLSPAWTVQFGDPARGQASQVCEPVPLAETQPAPPPGARNRPECAGTADPSGVASSA